KGLLAFHGRFVLRDKISYTAMIPMYIVEFAKIWPNAYVRFLASNGSNVNEGLMTWIIFMMITEEPARSPVVVTVVTIGLAATVDEWASFSSLLPHMISQPNPLAKLPYFLMIALPL